MPPPRPGSAGYRLGMSLATGTVERRDERIGLAAGVTVGFGAAAVLARDLGGLQLVCPLRALTDVPCPGCGMTSVASLLARGDVVGAVGSDPAGVVLVAAVAAVVLLHAAARLGRRWRGPADRVLVAVAGAALGAHWASTLLTG